MESSGELPRKRRHGLKPRPSYLITCDWGSLPYSSTALLSIIAESEKSFSILTAVVKDDIGVSNGAHYVIYAIQRLQGEFFGSQFLMPDLKAPRQTYFSWVGTNSQILVPRQPNDSVP